MTAGTALVTLGLTIAIIGVAMWLAARLTAWTLIAAWAIRRAYDRWRAGRDMRVAARRWARARRGAR